MPDTQAHSHYPFYVDGNPHCGCTEHFGLTPAQADAALSDPPEPPTDLLAKAEQKRRAEAAARQAKRRNRRIGGAS